MPSLRSPTLLVASLALALAALSGCGKNRVDCERMCARTFKECGEELLLVKKSVTKPGLEEIKADPERAAKLKASLGQQYDKCKKRCGEKKGYGSDARLINRCLKQQKSCGGYAECIKSSVN
jgi:hypothetical protein